MTINQTVNAILKPLNVPTFIHSASTVPTTNYITYFEYNQREALSEDDEETYTRYSIQIDVYGKGNIDSLVDQVRQAMTAGGFRRTYEQSLFEGSTKTYRKTMSFTITLKNS